MLVSIIVLTYNSELTIVETLESILIQKYPEIELVISDDESTDNTVILVKNWLNLNSKYFVNTIFIHGKKNIGISKNVNRGVRSSSGIWIKPLAGDDKLIENSIKIFVEYTKIHKEENCFISKLKLFGENYQSIAKCENTFQDYYHLLRYDRKTKLKNLIKNIYIPGPGIFYSRSLFDKVGGCNESYKMADEWPFFLKILASGVDIVLIEEQLVMYRITESSITRSNGSINYQLFIDSKRFFYKTRLWNMIYLGMFLDIIKQAINYYIYSPMPITLGRKLTKKLIDKIFH